MTNGITSKRKLWDDVTENKVKGSHKEYEFCKSQKALEQSVKFLKFLYKYSSEGFTSPSDIVSVWTEKDIHTLCTAMCRYDIHPDHWLDTIDDYTNRQDRSIKESDFLKQPKYKTLWGPNHVSPRERAKSQSKKEIEQERDELKTLLEEKTLEHKEYIETFDAELSKTKVGNDLLQAENERLKNRCDVRHQRNLNYRKHLKQAKSKCKSLGEHLEAEWDASSGDAYEKQLTLKDLNGTPDDLGWYKLDQMRRVQSELEAHFGVTKKTTKKTTEKLSLIDQVKALDPSLSYK